MLALCPMRVRRTTKGAGRERYEWHMSCQRGCQELHRAPDDRRRGRHHGVAAQQLLLGMPTPLRVPGIKSCLCLSPSSLLMNLRRQQMMAQVQTGSPGTHRGGLD